MRALAVFALAITLFPPQVQAYSHESRLATVPVRIGATIVHITAPATWWSLPPATRASFSSGCGPAGSGIRADRVLGMSFKEACNIHDYMYSTGGSEEYRSLADHVLWDNLQRIAESHPSGSLLFRKHAALAYYLACRGFGWAFFSYR